MGKPILYGHMLSPPVRAVLLVAKAIGLDLEFKFVDLYKAEHKREEFRKKNPQHTVPTLEDDGKYICESHAIVAYIIDKYAKDDNLYPKDLYQRALVNQRLFFDLEMLYTRLWNISMGIYRERYTTIPKDKRERISDAYNFMECFLTNDKFVAGDKMTVADLCCIASISSSQGFVQVTLENYPKLYDWMQRMSSLPYYEEANGEYAREYVQFLKDYLKKNAQED